MQNLCSVFELYMFLIFKNCLVLFSKHTRFFWQGLLAILLITQKSHLPSFIMILIKTVLFTFFPTKKRLKAKDNKDFDFILLASKNVKII